MNVYLSFDVEVWCNGWNELDEQFPSAFYRYVYGRSPLGDYALPKTLEILQRHGLKGVFFVEPLFAARFGLHFLTEIVSLIKNAGQEVQLHLHPEWTDEISPPPIQNVKRKRQHLCHYSLEEQTLLIKFGKQLLEAAGGGRAIAFRAGSYAANSDTYIALNRNDIKLDSSLNNCYEISGNDIKRDRNSNSPLMQSSVTCYPVSLFKDGFGSLRPAHITAVSFLEMRDALLGASQRGQSDFVIVSHNFELLRPNSSKPDSIVVNRFEQLCGFLKKHSVQFEVTTFSQQLNAENPCICLPTSSLTSTLRRFAEQLYRRM